MGSNTENDHTSGSRDAKPTAGAGMTYSFFRTFENRIAA